jgi:hypothetical protein
MARCSITLTEDIIDAVSCTSHEEATAALPVRATPASVHGQVHAGAGGVVKFDNRYSRDPVNLAHNGLDALTEGITQILTRCAALLRPRGIAVITARPWRHRGELVADRLADVPAQPRARNRIGRPQIASLLLQVFAWTRGGYRDWRGPALPGYEADRDRLGANGYRA